MLLDSNVTSFFNVIFGGPYEEIGVRKRIWRAGRAPPASAAAAPSMASVRIDGIVEAIDEAAPAPFTTEPCVYWHVRLISRRVMQGMNLGINTASPEVWNPVLVLSSTNNFWIVEDDGTRVLVDLDNLEVDDDDHDDDDNNGDGDGDGGGGDDNVIAVAALEDVSDHQCVNDDDEHLNAFLRDHDIVPIEEMGRSGDHRFLEARIAPGQRIAVWGRISELSSRTAVCYRDAATNIRRLTGTPSDPVIIISRT